MNDQHHSRLQADQKHKFQADEKQMQGRKSSKYKLIKSTCNEVKRSKIKKIQADQEPMQREKRPYLHLSILADVQETLRHLDDLDGHVQGNGNEVA
mgnify:CR=1 FL=1